VAASLDRLEARLLSRLYPGCQWPILAPAAVAAGSIGP